LPPGQVLAKRLFTDSCGGAAAANAARKATRLRVKRILEVGCAGEE
jgi:hypothetical protein